MGWTEAQLVAYESRRHAGATIPEARQCVMHAGEDGEACPKRAALAMRPTADEAKLNQTERRYLVTLRDQRPEPHDWIGVQCVTLKLADDTRYTPDFWTLTRGELVAHEVKGGFTRDDAWVKLKVAARLYPFIRFRLARYEKGGWAIKDVGP